MFSYNFVYLKLFPHTSSQFLALQTCLIQMFGNKIQLITLVFFSAIITYCVRRLNVCPFHRCSLYLGSPHMLVNQFVPLALPISKTPVSNCLFPHLTYTCLHPTSSSPPPSTHTHTHTAATFTVSTILIQCSFLNQISL